MVAGLPKEVDLPLRLRPWMSKIAEVAQEDEVYGRERGGEEIAREKEAMFFKYLPRDNRNGSSRYTFLITNLSSVWIEVLTTTPFLARHGEYLSESQSGSNGMSESERVEEGGRKVERMFDPRYAGEEGGWDGFELEVGGREGAETFELRSEDLFWQIKAKQLSAGQAIVILRDHFMIPMMGVLGAYGNVKMTADLEELTKAIDTTAIPASKGRLPQLLAATTEHSRTQTSLRRWAQGCQGMKDKKDKGRNQGSDGDDMVQIIEAYDEANSDIELPDNTPPAGESLPPPTMAQRQRSRSPSSVPAPTTHAKLTHHDEEPPLARTVNRTPSPESIPPPNEDYDSDATEPEEEEDAPGQQPTIPLPNTAVASSVAEPTAAASPVEDDNVDSDATDDEDDMDTSQQPSAHVTKHHGHKVVQSESDESLAGRVSLTRVRQEQVAVSHPDASTSSMSSPRRANKRKAEDTPAATTEPGKRVALGSGTGSSKGMVSRTAGKKQSVW